MKITAKFKTAIKSQSLPPTERAFYYHSLRVYLQVIHWKALMTTNADPLEWEQKVYQNFFAAIIIDLESSPKDLLNFVRYNCKITSRNTQGTNLCSCPKSGSTCVAECVDCRGESCDKSCVETEDNSEDRNLFEQFENVTLNLCNMNFIFGIVFMNLIQLLT